MTASSTAARWHVQLLGCVQAHAPAGRSGHAQTLHRWPSRATACLLARLALAPQRMHPREELVELLWPGVPAGSGRARLRTTLSLLRSLLEPVGSTEPAVIHADRHAVHVTPGALSCDALQFEQAASAGDAALARALYAGELMPGHFDDWVLTERRRLESLHGQLGGSVPPAVPPLRPAASPAHAPAGHGAAHTSVELIGPLPRYWTAAFGQGGMVARLVETATAHRLVTLLGPGGTGKTRLAAEAAMRLAEGPPVATGHAPAQAPRFARVVFASLADCHGLDTLLPAMQALLQTPAQAGVGDSIVHALQGLPTLLVMDNVEQFDAASAQAVTHWLQRLPLLHVLMTSRRRLGLDGERVVDLPGLPGPAVTAQAEPASAADAAAAMAAAAQSPAVALFVDRAQASRAGFHLTPANTAALVGLVRLLGGMPLAIELAASRLRALQPRELLQRLQQEAGSPLLDLLARPQAVASQRSRHASMRHVVRWSWQQLDPAQTDLLCAMAVFGAPATLPAVAQALAGWVLAQGDPAPASATTLAHQSMAAGLGVGSDPGCGADLAALQATLGEVVDASLVQTGPATGSDQTLYQLLPPVREFALEQCRPAALRAVRSRLRLWLAASARAHLPQGRDRLHDDLQHAWRLLLLAKDDGAPDEVLALAVATQGEWATQPASPAVQQVLQWALDQAGGRAPDALVSEGHYVLAALHQLCADSALALVHANAAIAAAPDDRCRGLALSMRCWIGLQTGAALDAVRLELAEALQRTRRSGDPRALALVLRLQASLHLHHLADARAAAVLFEEAIRLFEDQGNLQQACNRQVELASCWVRMGHAADALDLAQACVQRCRAQGLAMVLIYALTGLGDVQLQLRAPDAAAAALEEAAHLAARDGWSALLLPALLPLAQAWQGCGDSEPAAQLLGHVLARWPALLGRFNRLDAQTVRRTRRLLQRALGAQRTAWAMRQGAVAPLPQILQRRGQDRTARARKMVSTATDTRPP